MHRRMGLGGLGAGLVLLALLAIANTAVADTVTIGTAAPRNSPWGKVFRVWGMAVKKETAGRLELKFYWNNQQGSEETMIGKMRAGQLDGAAMTIGGLAKVYQPILALQAPGLFHDWETLDRVRDELAPEFQAGARKNGFYIGGWGDIGLHYFMSTHKPIRSPADLQGTLAYRIIGDDNLAVFAQVVGGKSLPMSVAEVLPSLTSKRINVCQTPALAADQLQWAPQYAYLTDMVVTTGIGAIVFSQQALDRLPQEEADVLRKTATKAGRMLTKRIRKLDHEAYERIKGRLQVVTPTATERAAWEEKFAETRRRLAQGTFEPAFMAKLERLAGK
jgi:TRAP-type C4-dicarboxylate transport system substrate-binding protein